MLDGQDWAISTHPPTAALVDVQFPRISCLLAVLHGWL
jgi:hypothetical protein